MKSISIILLSITLFTNCHQSVQIQELSACNDMDYTRAKELIGIETRVVQNKDYNIFFIEQPGPKTGFSPPWNACNLPEKYKKDNLRIRFDGFVLTYPGMENQNRLGNPIELTNIQVISDSL